MQSRKSGNWIHPIKFFRVFRRKRVPAEAVTFGQAIEVAILWNI